MPKKKVESKRKAMLTLAKYCNLGNKWTKCSNFKIDDEVDTTTSASVSTASSNTGS